VTNEQIVCILTFSTKTTHSNWVQGELIPTDTLSYWIYIGLQSWRDLKPKFQSIESIVSSDGFDIFQPVKQSCVVWSLDMLSCHCVTDIEEFVLTNCTNAYGGYGSKRTNDTNVWPHKMDSPNFQTFLFASSDLRLQEDRPCMCQLFRCCCVSWLETKPDVADQKGGTEGGKSWQITCPTIFQRCQLFHSMI